MSWCLGRKKRRVRTSLRNSKSRLLFPSNHKRWNTKLYKTGQLHYARKFKWANLISKQIHAAADKSGKKCEQVAIGFPFFLLVETLPNTCIHCQVRKKCEQIAIGFRFFWLARKLARDFHPITKLRSVKHSNHQQFLLIRNWLKGTYVPICISWRFEPSPPLPFHAYHRKPLTYGG